MLKRKFRWLPWPQEPGMPPCCVQDHTGQHGWHWRAGLELNRPAAVAHPIGPSGARSPPYNSDFRHAARPRCACGAEGWTRTSDFRGGAYPSLLPTELLQHEMGTGFLYARQDPMLRESGPLQDWMPSLSSVSPFYGLLRCAPYKPCFYAA